jgi:hypothetical protein
MLDLNSNALSHIASFCTVKEATVLAQTCKATDRWWRNYVAKDSPLLSIYLNNVVKNCSTEEEVASHLERIEHGHVTPFDLCFKNTQIKLLYPIKKKLQNLQNLTYERPERVLKSTSFFYKTCGLFCAFIPLHLFFCLIYMRKPFSYASEGVERKIFAYFSDKARDFAKDQALHEVARLYPKIEKLTIRFSKSTP